MLDLLKTIFKYKQKRSPDQLGLYPENVHTNAIPERRYLWTSRLLVIFSSLSICLNLMLVATLYIMLPQREASPRLLTADNSLHQLKLLSRQEVTVAPKDLLFDAFIREYVLMRHSITSQYDEMKARWQPGSRFYWMSAENVYKDFVSDDLEQILYYHQTHGYTRKVDIEQAYPISNGLWFVRFATYDYYNGSSTPVINIWHAYIRAVLAMINYDNVSLRYHNPFGFRVLSYSLSYIGSPQNISGYMKAALNQRLRQHY